MSYWWVVFLCGLNLGGVALLVVAYRREHWRAEHFYLYAREMRLCYEREACRANGLERAIRKHHETLAPDPLSVVERDASLYTHVAVRRRPDAE